MHHKFTNFWRENSNAQFQSFLKIEFFGRNLGLSDSVIVTQCLKITQKVAFNILSGQKLIKNAKNFQFWRVYENLKLTV